MRKLIDEDSNILSQGFNSNWIIRIKKNILSHGYSYPPLIFSLISYIALYCIQKEVQADNAGLYLFVQYSMLAILPALIVFELRPIIQPLEFTFSLDTLSAIHVVSGSAYEYM